jgi:hypothetical protein
VRLDIPDIQFGRDPPFPSHDVIVLSKPSSFAEVGMASLMFAEANMAPFLHEHRNEPVTAEVPAGDQCH